MKKESQQRELIKCDIYFKHYLSDTEESIVSITAELTAAVLKTVYFDSFSSKLLKAKMFMI